jgi:hypothetical protein
VKSINQCDKIPCDGSKVHVQFQRHCYTGDREPLLARMEAHRSRRSEAAGGRDRNVMAHGGWNPRLNPLVAKTEATGRTRSAAAL